MARKTKSKPWDRPSSELRGEFLAVVGRLSKIRLDDDPGADELWDRLCSMRDLAQEALDCKRNLTIAEDRERLERMS